MGNLNPSLTITAVSGDWTEVVLADVMPADNISTDRRETHGIFPVLIMLLLTEKHCTVLCCTKKDRLSLTTFPTGSFPICFELH